MHVNACNKKCSVHIGCMTEKQIKKLRARLKLSQAEFADLLGVDQSTISRMENGWEPSKPVLKLLQQLAVTHA